MAKTPTAWPEAIAFLKSEANTAYVWDKDLSYWSVKNRWYFWDYPAPVPTQPSLRLRDAFLESAKWHQNHPSLRHNFMMTAWPKLTDGMQTRIASFFEERGLSNFDFLDHGGRAMVFQARDTETGRIRIARMEADHSSRTRRLNHPTVLQPYHHNEDDLAHYDNVKLEILPEIVPLHKIPGRRVIEKSEQGAYHAMTYFLAHGTNLTYDDDIYDYDASVENVGLLPDGKIVSLDPQFLGGEAAAPPRRIMDAAPEMKALRPHVAQIYGLPANDLYF